MSTAVLACSRATRTTTFTRYVTRTLSTEAVASSDSTPSASAPDVSSPLNKLGGGKRRKGPAQVREAKNAYTVYVRAWDEIDSMPAFFAMLRGVEKRFGKVREFRIGRDYDLSNRYMDFFLADFVDEESLNRVPEKGTNIRVEVPVIPKGRPGGVGLDDLQGLLQPQDWDSQTAGEGVYATPIPLSGAAEGAQANKTRIAELVVKRSTSTRTENISKQRVRDSTAFGVAFHRWAGFYQSSSAETTPEMRAVLAKWERAAAEDALRRRSKLPVSLSSDTVDTHSLDTHPADATEYTAREQQSIDDARVESAKPSVPAFDMTRPVTQSELSTDPSAASGPTDSSGAPASALPEHATLQTQAPAHKPAPRLSQREKILQRARQHARTPLPEPMTQEAEEERKAAEEARRKEKQAELGSMRERLLKLIGGNWS
ncbi:hypothetical protein C8Q79DRAFT_927205 [Trametes meyenii]|nr:hypothetical protein C8Q79DRAFT_927205 [Trametes meyenii]